MNKKARDTFEELGYKIECDDVNWLIYNFENVFKILFYKPHQEIQIIYERQIYNSIDMEELQAINQQCKELGWFDE